MAKNDQQGYHDYWKRHSAAAYRLEMTVFFGRNYDRAVQSEDWRRLLALERWARIWKFPILADRARRAAKRYINPKEQKVLEVLACRK